ncbi:MAG TPA: hypothetical protein V6C69_15035 [Trichormus sp.]|jgi:hypothetical protein
MRLSKVFLNTLTMVFGITLVINAGMLSATAADTVSHDRIDELDTKFIGMYEAARDDLLAHGDPILLFHRGAVALYNHGKVVAKVDYLPQEFQTLKTIDHITLGIYVALVDRHDRLSDQRITQLKDFLAAIDAARPQVAEQHFSDDSIAKRQMEIIDVSTKFLHQVIENKGCTTAEMDTYMSKMTPLSYANIKDAVHLDLSKLNTAVQKLLEPLSDTETRSLRVVMFGSHMARIEESHWQYFSRLLDEPAEGHRVIYFEGNGEDTDGLALLGAHMLDEHIGLEYFGSSWRMHRDLLSAAASQWLDEHPVKRPGMAARFHPEISP